MTTSITVKEKQDYLRYLNLVDLYEPNYPDDYVELAKKDAIKHLALELSKPKDEVRDYINKICEKISLEVFGIDISKKGGK